MGIWKVVLFLYLFVFDLVEYGYVRYEFFKMLFLIIVLDGVILVLDEIMVLIKCNCEGVLVCRNMRCSCSRSKLLCILFCKCNGGDECLNEFIRMVVILREVID